MPEGFVEQIHPSTIHLFNITDASPACGTLSTRHTGSHASQSSAVPFAPRSGRKFVESFTLHSSSFTSKKAAFTLAEVLITLGIIGVVAAMTLPAVINKYQKKEAATRLAQAYSVVSQAIKLSELENGPMEYWETGDFDPDAPTGTGEKKTADFVKKYVQPYMKSVNEHLMYSSGSPYDYYYYTRDGQLVTGQGHTHYSIALMNGTYLHFNANYNNSERIRLRIDINGMKKPNIIGRDTFYATFYPKFAMTGEGQTREELIELCAGGRTIDEQATCGALIQQDGWEIKDDYPW